MSARIVFVVVLAAGALAGCGGPDIGDVCSNQFHQCGDQVQDCYEDAAEVQARAENLGCEDRFEDYLSCLDRETHSCNFKEACSSDRQRLEQCVGPFR